MKFHNITKDDMLNGEGLRVVLWVSGCEHHCIGCQNPCTWNPEDGSEFDDSAKQEIFEQLECDYISGITFSGGDPLYTGNREPVLNLMKEIHNKYPNKTIWCYTGYTYEDISHLEHMKYIDILVDGKFIEIQKDNTLHWYGSANQRIIDVQKSSIDKVAILDL